MPVDPSILRVIYLHGFASSPRSNKAQRFSQALQQRGISHQLPDLNEGAFRELTVSRQLALLRRLTADCRPGSVVLIGSSLGGYTAALFAAEERTVAAVVLMAPAFDFARRWRQRLGDRALARWQERGAELVPHYGTGTDELIGYGLMEDAGRHAPYPACRVPALVFHGRQDDVVDAEVSVEFARRAPQQVHLELFDDDHTLAASIDLIVTRSLAFLAGIAERSNLGDR